MTLALPARRLFAPLLGALLIGLGAAAPASAQQADPAMLAKLKQLYPRTQFTSVSTSPLPGLTEVVMGQNVAYVDSTGRYWFFGRLWDMQTQQDLTEPRVEQAARVSFNELPFADAIKEVRGSGRRQLAVFVDPNCGFCKRLEDTLSGVSDVTIYTFLLPILGPESADKARAIWCAADAPQALRRVLLRGETLPPATCDVTAIERNRALAQRLNVTGTPTIFFASGRRVPGAMQREPLEQALNETAAMVVGQAPAAAGARR
jgi:thiol:disulfide interchange protein DsbC